MGCAKLKQTLFAVVLHALVALIFNEYLIYYVTIWKCKWPSLSEHHTSRHDFPLRVLVLSDPHLLGDVQGHWFDKLRREWQMQRSYHASLALHRPDVAFILGDLFDEGKYATQEQWEKYKRNAHKVFETPDHTELHVVVGNHDVGFHYAITRNKLTRFFNAFQTDNVQAISMRGNVFVLINSMGLDKDGCFMCNATRKQLRGISTALSCSQGTMESDVCERYPKYPGTKPILLLHFPLYRESDRTCNEVDSAPEQETFKFRENYDVLSKSASDEVLKLLKPRLVLSGHTHDGCRYVHPDGTPEITVPSYSWRNRRNPSFYLMTVSPHEVKAHKCFLPNEFFVFFVYIFAGFILLLRLHAINCVYNKRLSASRFSLRLSLCVVLSVVLLFTLVQ